MRLFTLTFLFGILAFQKLSHLPNQKWILIFLVIAVLIIILKRFIYRYEIPLGLILGFSWCFLFVSIQMSWTLPNEWEGKNVLVSGFISSLPEKEKFGTGFLFHVKKIEYNQTRQDCHSLFRLTLPNQFLLQEKLNVGDEWQWLVRLKRIHSTLNPGGFDYEAWALHEGIRAHGYIVGGNINKLMNSQLYHFPLNRIRQYLQEKIESNLPKSNTSPWITALVIGERHDIESNYWEVLRNTGTNHLMAIAGLHIGFMAGFAYTIFNWVWRRFHPLVLMIPAQQVGSIAALIMALSYSALAGFSIPTQRACIMLVVFLTIVLLRRKTASWQAWSLALISVLFINPLSVLTESFWLSFGSVALIIYGISGRLAPHGWWWKWGRIQWVIAVGLIPLSICLFQQCSIVSFLANSIAIPCVGFLIVPLCLVGTFILLFSVKLGTIILIAADKLLGYLWIILEWFSHFSWSSWYQVAPSWISLFLACLGVLILLVPKGFPGRYFGFIGLLPLFFAKIATPQLGEAWVTLLDVGQGLASVVQTKNHILVFDTGAKLSDSFDMGESVVAPYLRTLHVPTVDMLVVSHGDNDHIGGAEAILKRFSVKSIKTSVPEKLPTVNTSYCARGETWEWDGVHFNFLYPSPDNLGRNNDSSCVLRISVGNHHVLFTGDIEKYSERYLVENEKETLPADILVAPHHGSKTSGEKSFIANVHPHYILFPIGYRNRYRFPHVSVIRQYEAIDSTQLDSVHSGAIVFHVTPNEISKPFLYRVMHHRYWNDC